MILSLPGLTMLTTKAYLLTMLRNLLRRKQGHDSAAGCCDRERDSRDDVRAQKPDRQKQTIRQMPNFASLTWRQPHLKTERIYNRVQYTQYTDTEPAHISHESASHVCTERSSADSADTMYTDDWHMIVNHTSTTRKPTCMDDGN